MKKTLLIAVAALAASVISSQAQVYSANIVGYANLPLGNGSHFVLLVNPLTNTAVNAETVIPTLDAGDVIQIWNTTSFSSYQYQGGPDGYLTGTNDWLDQNNNQVEGPSLLPGEGFFFSAQSGDNETNTFVGTVLLTNAVPLGSGGFALVGSTPPVASSVDTNGVFSLPLDAGDVVQTWQSTSFNSYQYQGGPDGYLTFPNDWLDQNNNQVPAPVISVGQGFFYSAQSGNTETWNQNFVVQ
jgi:hypothetical protein